MTKTETKDLALASMLAALGTVAMIVATYSPTLRLYLTWLAGFLIYLLACLTGAKYSWLALFVIGLLTFFLTGNLIALVDLLLFYGPYGVLKNSFDVGSVRWLRRALKALFFLGTNTLLAYLAIWFFGGLDIPQFFLRHRALLMPFFIFLFLFTGFYYDWALGRFYNLLRKRLRL